MPFPPAARVIYARNPLDEVICQVRFPGLLKVETEPPVRFQEYVQEAYPQYKLTAAVKLPSGIPSEAVHLLAGEVPVLGQRNHAFDSRDEAWSLHLNREFLALTCRSYERWEAFRQRLATALDALVAVYRPAFFTRLGLRYTDVIRRSALGLDAVPWAELIRPEFCGPLGTLGSAGEVCDFQQQCLFNLPDDAGKVRVRCYLGQDSVTQETVFVIDSDFFLDQQTELADVLSRLDALKRQSGYLFRWGITDRLHEAMRPGPVPDPGI